MLNSPSQPPLLVPQSCFELIKHQRSHLKHPWELGFDLNITYEAIRDYLPQSDSSVKLLDIGAGLAGIDVFLSRHYGGDIDIHLMDFDQVDDKINAGFHDSATSFSKYSRFNLAYDMLGYNWVNTSKVKQINLSRNEGYEHYEPFDIVISLLSWGFHYPIDTYKPELTKRGVVIVNLRKGSDGTVNLTGLQSLYPGKQFVIVQDSIKHVLVTSIGE